MFGLTIDRFVQYLTIILLFALGAAAYSGWRQITEASKLPFFMLRRRKKQLSEATVDAGSATYTKAQLSARKVTKDAVAVEL